MAKISEFLKKMYDNLGATYLQLYFMVGNHTPIKTALHGRKSCFITEKSLEEFSRRFSVMGSKPLNRELPPDHLIKSLDKYLSISKE